MENKTKEIMEAGGLECFRCKKTIPREFPMNIGKDGFYHGTCLNLEQGGCGRKTVFVPQGYQGFDDNKTTLGEEMEEFINQEVQKQKELNIQAAKESLENALKQEKEVMITATLSNVYATIDKWLGIRIKDRNRIDVVLATALSNKEKGTPIWLFIIGNSGDWKTALVRSLDGLSKVIKVDILTENTLASGKINVEDLGEELQNSSHILLFLDLASLTSMNKDKKNAIWGQFRILYDGYIIKRTGNGINKKYENCHVTLIACATETLRDEILLNSHLGTRELLYDTDAEAIDNDFKMDKAIFNEKYEQEMTEEIRKAVNNFILYHKVKDIEPSKEMLDFLKSEANRLTILRATGIIDYNTAECISPIYPEVPTRLIKQFVKLYRCLKSLDDNYPDEKAKEIITHIVNSSGNNVRQMILNILEKSPKHKFKIPEVQQEIGLGRKSVKTQLEVLWNLGVVDKEVREERIGGYVHNYEGFEEIRGGHLEEISYYKYRPLSHILLSEYSEYNNINNKSPSIRTKDNRSPLEFDDFVSEHLQEIVDFVQKNYSCIDEDTLCSEIKQELFSKSTGEVTDEKLHQLVKDTVKIVSEIIEDANGPSLTDKQLVVFEGIIKFYKSASISIVIKKLISKGGVKDEVEAANIINLAVDIGLVRKINNDSALKWISS